MKVVKCILKSSRIGVLKKPKKIKPNNNNNDLYKNKETTDNNDNNNNKKKKKKEKCHKNRKRKIIWFNPSFCKLANINIGKYFF